MHFTTIILVLWLLFLAYWFISAASAKKDVNRSWTGRVVRTGIALAIYAYFRTARPHLHSAPFVSSSAPLGVAGVLICLAGICLAIWARRHIGRNWGMPMSIKAEPELVDTGPYARIRHPIYTGIMAAMLGSAIAGGWGWGVLLVVFGAYFVYSAKTEEKRLSQLMPHQYPAYMRRTKMLVPFIF